MLKIISGSGGSSSDSGGRAAVEDPDSLQSRAMLKLLDLVGEGKIGGLVSDAQSVFINDTPLQNSDGSMNFSGVTWEARTGEQDQTDIPGFSDIESPFNESVQVKTTSSHTVTITNPNADQARIIVAVPALVSQDMNTGDTHGSSVSYRFDISTNGGPFQPALADTTWNEGGTSTIEGEYTKVVPVVGAIAVGATVGLSIDGSLTFRAQYLSGGAWHDVSDKEYTLKLETTQISDPTGMAPTPVLSSDSKAEIYIQSPVGAESLRFKVVSAVGTTQNSSGYTDFAGIMPPMTEVPLPTIKISNIKSCLATADCVISGKTRSRYQRSHLITLPKPGSLWSIRMTRTNPDSTSAAVSNDLYFDSYIEIVSSKLNYPNSALVGMAIDSSLFNQMPNRAYLVDGLYIKVPSNYNSTTREYAGVWDGTFKLAVSNNPAWVLYDLLTHKRYGLGQYIQQSQVDKARLYQIGRYCDELVPNGYGGLEPRFTFNTAIQEQAEAYKVISDLCSVFRGMAYWTGGKVGFTLDAPTDPSMTFTAANVVDGVFDYTGSARKDRHTVVLVTWNDPTERYKQKIEYVEDAELVAKYGIRKVETLAFGCTSRGQANRVGRWMLFTEKHESDMVTFKVGLDSALVMPGDVIQIHDPYRAGKRFGGRLIDVTAISATLDAPVILTTTQARIAIRLEDGTLVERIVTEGAGEHLTVTWAEPLTTLPISGAIWLMSEPGKLEPMLARVVGVAQDGTKLDSFVISALEHNPSKYGAIEYGLSLEIPRTSILSEGADGVKNLEVSESTYLPSPSVVAFKMLVSWEGKYQSYELSYRTNPDAPITEEKFVGIEPAPVSNWTTISTANPLIEILNVRKGDIYEFMCVGIDAKGVKSPVARAYHLVAADVNAYPVGAVSGGEYFWNGRDCKISWNFNSATSSYEFGSEPAGADDGSLDPIFRDYEVKIFSADGKKLRRTEYVVTNTYTYSYDKNVEDGITRHIHVEVRQRTILNSLGKPFVVDCENPSPQITGVTANATYNTVSVAYTENGDPDFSGAVIYLSDDAAKVESMSDDCIVYDGPDSNIVISNVMFNLTYYYRVLAYDLFGKAGTIPSAMASIKTPFMDIDAIAEGALGESVLNPDLRSRIDLIDSPASVFGSVNARLQALEASIGENVGTFVNTKVIELVDADKALAASIDAVAAIANDNASAITTEQTTRASADNAISTQLSALASRVGTTEAAIVSEQTARASADDAAAYSITQLTSTVGTNTTTLQTQAESINGLGGKYTVKIDNNGYVTGYGLASTTNNGVPTSEFVINADRFAVVTPGNPSKHPFVIGPVDGITTTIISNALIGDAAINTAKIGDAAISSAKIADAAITKAKIKDLSVDTIKIAGNAVTMPMFSYGKTNDLSMTYEVTGEPGETYLVFILCTVVQGYFSVISFEIDGVTQWQENPIAGSLATRGYAVLLSVGSHNFRLWSDNAGNINGTSIYALATKR